MRTVAAGIDSVIANQRLIAGLVKDLASEELAVREAATKGLLAGGYPALVAFKDAAASAMPEEVRARAGEIAKQLAAKGFTIPAHGIVGDNLRFVRAVHTLEAIGGADARAQIERIATISSKDDRANVLALAALKRMRK